MRKPILTTAGLLLIGVIFLAGNGRIFGTAGPVTDDQAAKYAGRRTVVHGIVVEVRQVGDTAYVNFGQEYPFQTFSAIISPEHYSRVFRSIPVADEEGGFGEYWVTGRVEIVDGRAIVRVTKQNQIVSDAQLPQDD